MSIDLSALAADMAAVIADLPTSFTFSGAVYTGVLTDLNVGSKLRDEGFEANFKGRIYALQSVFSVLPVAGVTLSVGSTSYRVDNVIKSPDNVGIVLDLVDLEI